MTDFMTAFHLILVQLTCPRDQRVKAVHIHSVCTRCQESHKTQNPLLRSDAMLYAPSLDDIKNNCEHVSLKCYTEELTMVLDEQQIISYADCIFEFDKALTPRLDGCPVCETYPLKNITIFLERLDTLLKKIITDHNM